MRGEFYAPPINHQLFFLHGSPAFHVSEIPSTSHNPFAEESLMSSRCLSTLALVLLFCACLAAKDEPPFRDSFDVPKENFVAQGKNSFFNLEPRLPGYI
jgi:hypothetical protein